MSRSSSTTAPTSALFARSRPTGALISSASAEERGQAVALLGELTPHLPGERLEGIDVHSSALVLPPSSDAPVDEKRRDRLRSLRIEDDRPVALRQDLRASRVD